MIVQPLIKDLSRQDRLAIGAQEAQNPVWSRVVGTHIEYYTQRLEAISPESSDAEIVKTFREFSEKRAYWLSLKAFLQECVEELRLEKTEQT